MSILIETERKELYLQLVQQYVEKLKVVTTQDDRASEVASEATVFAEGVLLQLENFMDLKDEEQES